MKIFILCVMTVFAASAQQYSASTFAGSAVPPTPSAAINAGVGNTNSVARDAAGNIYFSSGQSVFKVDAGGTLNLVAGNGTIGYSGDGGTAAKAQLSNPWGVAVDKGGNVYIADEVNNRVRRVSPAGVITTVAGVGTPGFSGDGGAAADSELHYPLNVMVDGGGNLYIGDYFNGRIRKVTPDGIIQTIAGGGTNYPGDNGKATDATIPGPSGMAMDAAGNIFVADRNGMRVRKVSTGGTITTVAGTGVSGFTGDNGAATSAQMYLPSDVAVDAAGSLYIADFNNNRIRKVTSSGIISSLFAGLSLSGPSGVVLDATGNIYIADRFNSRIEEVSPGGLPTLIAGNGSAHFSGDGGPAASAQFGNVTGVAINQAGTIFVADGQNSRIRAISPSGVVSTFAGGGFGTDGSQATNANLVNPQGVALDNAGNVYIADTGAQRIRKVSAGGIISTIAGNGAQGNAGDGGLALQASLFNPSAIAVDGSGNVYILGQTGGSGNFISGNNVRKVAPNGIISTVVAATTIVPATPVAQSYSPVSIAVDAAGNLFVAETTLVPVSISSGSPAYASQILRIASTGETTLFAQAAGTMGVDSAGNLILTGGNTVQKITPSGVVSTFPVNGSAAANAIAVDSSGKIYAAEQYSVVVLQPVTGSAAGSPVVVGAVVDAASESIVPISPGKIVVIYGAGLGPAGVSNQPGNGGFSTSLGGTSVTFNGIRAPILYTSPTEIIAVVPYGVGGPTAQVVATYQAQLSPAISVPVALTSPSLFTRNQTGAGQLAAVNVVDGSLNTAGNPVKVGDYISLFATGEGQTSAAGVDGALGGTQPNHPNGNVFVTVGGQAANVQYSGSVLGNVLGLMQVNVQIPAGVAAGGYVPVVLKVGDASSNSGTWIAVGN